MSLLAFPPTLCVSISFYDARVFFVCLALHCGLRGLVLMGAVSQSERIVSACVLGNSDQLNLVTEIVRQFQPTRFVIT